MAAGESCFELLARDSQHYVNMHNTKGVYS
jgi:hypothetical protein